MGSSEPLGIDGIDRRAVAARTAFEYRLPLAELPRLQTLARAYLGQALQVAAHQRAAARLLEALDFAGRAVVGNWRLGSGCVALDRVLPDRAPCAGSQAALVAPRLDSGNRTDAGSAG